MFRHILVVIDGTIDSREALDQAVDLAQRERSRLTLIAAERRLPACAYLGVAAAVPLAVPAAETGTCELMREAVDRVPHDVPVTTMITPLAIRGAVMRQIEDGCHDLVVLGAAPCGRVLGALGTLGRYLVRHSPVPVLVVHAGREPRPVAARPARAQLRLRRSRAAT